jgi:L-asparaginase
MTLRIIATGGTFDKHYNPLDGSLVFGHSVLPHAIERARLSIAHVFQPLLAMDSLDMQDSHRQQILAACHAAPEEKIVIVHGTDTLRDTAALIAAANLDKTVVLTGAMVPYDIADSDALFNLGSAITAAQLSAAGVWVAMQGEVYAWNKVRKNRAAGRFEHSD